MASSLLINLSCLPQRPTGIAVYTRNVFPYLKPLEPTLLTAREIEGFACDRVPGDMTPDEGTRGHLKRLLWTQFRLPFTYRHLQGRLLFSPLPEAPLFAGCRSVVMAHDLIPLRFPQPRSRLTAYFRHYVPQVLKQAQHIVCNSQATAQDLVDFFQIPAAKISPIWLAYDADHFRPLDLPTRNYFLHLGRRESYKNLERLIDAFAALPSQLDCELWFAGPDDQRYSPLLHQQVAELGLAERVKFLDYVPYADLPKLLGQAIALVYPSLWEGFGLPLLEAMACGTPVISSNCAALAEVAGDAALLVDPLKVAEIAEAMQLVATDGEARSQLRELGLARSRTFSWQKTGEATAAILQQYL